MKLNFIYYHGLLLAMTVVLTCAALAGESSGQHQGDVLIGMTSASQLRVDSLPLGPVSLPPVSSGSFFGWASNTLGFDAIVNADAEVDVYPVAAGADIYIEVVSIDPGLSLRSFSAFTSVFADEAGERLRIGATGSLHWHPIAFVDGNYLGSQFYGVRTVTAKLVDVGVAGLSESAPFELEFLVRSKADYDRNGSVGPEDYEVWKTSFATSFAAADGNGDGVVDAADYTIWRDAFADSPPSGSAGSAAVPEPGVRALLSACASILSLATRLRRRISIVKTS